MKVAIVSKSDSTGGGAGRSAETLTRLLNQNGHLAHHWIGFSGKPLKPHMRKLCGDCFGQVFFKFSRFISRTIGLPDFLTPEIFYHLANKEIEYDLYHFQDISSVFSPIAFRWLAKRYKVIWTFRDCSPFTAGCIYPLDCEAFKVECRKCPQIGDWPLLTSVDFSSYMHRYKRNTARQGLFQAVTPCEWLANEAMKSGFFSEKPVVIHNSVNSDVFKPLDKAETRTNLNLPLDTFIVLISSMDLESKYKGTIYALSALREFNKSIFVLAVGKENHQSIHITPCMDIKFTGIINNDELLAQYYAAADIFLFPTLADNLPNVVLETMACGTPSVAFATGGVPEMIEHDKTGWLATPKDTRSLVDGIKVAMSDKNKLKSWGIDARAKALKEFNETILINKYLNLYNKVLSE